MNESRKGPKWRLKSSSLHLSSTRGDVVAQKSNLPTFAQLANSRVGSPDT